MTRRAAFRLGGVDVAPGSRQTIDLPVSVLSDHTPVTMSAHVIHGRKPGPTVFVSAGIHGDEVIGVEIVRRLLTIRNLQTLRGTLICIPIVNAPGFLIRSRYLPDRRDLNRSFPGSDAGSLASRLADIFLRKVVSRCDLGIDLHSAAAHRTNLPQIRISPGNTETRRLARLFGAPVVLRSPLRDGSLRGAAHEIGVDVLLYEAGEALRFDEMSVRAGVMGILRVLQDKGMISRRGVSRAKADPVFCTTSRWIRAGQGGLLRTYKSEGDTVRQGDVLAVVSDPFGEVEAEVIATLPGIIVGRAVMPIVNEGDALFHVARVENGKEADDKMTALSTQLEDDPLFDEDEII
ncbi:succinylglutamate desuccinylase [Aliiroseovarius zhejiangensis]|uniref:Succinylglutamate desuccinylase n=1 Tax=Aliiroseovarius zhejiangensis TaxID=1632025 RepID=A0ABQ3ILR0_9RHOB|nr:succinylglutamate desuccinylase/aspartoacylase family protein [Aliiroseovarius zhejiangensis]GHE85721.1 succinylglutamate desuccinylase [Aliiroseovarius zhejiangensis]